VLVVAGAIAVGGYFGYSACEKGARRHHRGNVASTEKPAKPDTAPVPVLTTNPVKPQTLPVKPVPVVVPVKPAAPERLSLQVTAIHTVWVGVWADGKQVQAGNIAAGQTKTIEADRVIKVTAGMAGALQLKLNGVTQPSLGSMKTIGKGTYTRSSLPKAAPAVPAPGAGTPGN
jgi:hypothetical protein